MKDYMENARKMLESRIVNYKIEIEVLKKIKPIIAKWDNKVLNKRFATALTKECSDFPWTVEFYIYKERRSRGIYFVYHDSRNLCQTCYVTEKWDVLMTVDPDTMRERINANAWVANINATINWTTSQTVKLESELINMPDLIERNNQLIQIYNKFRSSLSGSFIDIMEKNYLFARM